MLEVFKLKMKQRLPIPDNNIFHILQQIEPESTDLDASNATMHEKEIMELKAKFLRHKEILKSNCDQAESEVIRLDEIYHDTVDMVLKVHMNIATLNFIKLFKVPKILRVFKHFLVFHRRLMQFPKLLNPMRNYRK